MRERIEQPPRTRLCGQVALAVILRISLEDAIALVGHRKGTRTKELAAVLCRMGYGTETPARRMSTPPPLGLAIMRPPGRKTGNWHWVVVENGRIIDGSPSPTTLERGWIVSSYVPVVEPRFG